MPRHSSPDQVHPPKDELSPKQLEWKEYAEAAAVIARGAGDILMRRRTELIQRKWKERHHFNTLADDESDAYIRQEINEQYPDHGIISEESPDKTNARDVLWVVDPLDGTISYASNVSDHFGVSIGLVRNRQPLVGVLNFPARRELFRAQQGLGAWRNDQRIRVADLEDLHQALIGIDYGKVDRQGMIAGVNQLVSPEGVTYPVTFGSATSSLSLVADGRLNGYYAEQLEPWDMAAAVAIIREAGGAVTDSRGKEWELGDHSIVASNPRLHTKLLEQIHARTSA